MKAVVPDADADAGWVAWSLRAAEGHLLRDCRRTGTTVASIEMSRWYAQVMPLPPLQEQRRIVQILEDHLSRLEAANALLARSRARLDRWRRSILLEAALGQHLVVGPSSLPMGAALGAERPPAVALPSGWQWQKWKDIGSSQNGKAFPSSDYCASGVRLLRPGNLGSDGRLLWPKAATRYMPTAYREMAAGRLLRTGDVVVNLTAQSLKDDFLGRACLVGPEMKRCSTSDSPGSGRQS